jgi:uncharacterized membrane protein YfhO
MGLLIACLGIWYFLRLQGFRIFPALIGMLVYILSGPVFFLHSYHLDFMGIALLPWGLWAFHQYDRIKTDKWLWLSAVCCLLAVQNVEPDNLTYLFGGFIIDRFICLPKGQRRLYIISWAGIFILSGLTGLLLYLPLYEWINHSSRVLKSYAGILNPGFFNMASAILTNRWLTFWRYDSFYFYLGPAIIWFTLAGCLSFKKQAYIFRYFLYALSIPIIYVFARSFQFFHSSALDSLDLWRSMFVFCFGLSMVSAQGVQNILERKTIKEKIALSLVLAILAAIWALQNKMYSIVIIIVAVVIACIWMDKRKRFAVFGISIVCLTTLLLPAVLSNVQTQFCIIRRGSRYIKNLASFSKLNTDSCGRKGHWRASILQRSDNTTAFVDLKSVPNYTSIYNKQMEDIFCLDGLIKRDNQHPYWMRLQYVNAEILSLYGVRFLIVWGDLGAEEINKTDWFERPDLAWFVYHVWENKYYLGRAYLLDSAGQRRKGGEFIEDNPVSVVLRVESKDGDRFVLADLNYPGWEAYVDGKKVSVEVYHGCLRSVKLSKGWHIVRWAYNGHTQRLGLILSALALFALIYFLARISVFKELPK